TAVSSRGDASLAPEYDDLILTRRHHARLHVALRLGRLQGAPCCVPRWTLLLQTACSATIRERWRPVHLAIGMDELEEPSLVTSRIRTEEVEHHLDMLFDTHDSLFLFVFALLSREQYGAQGTATMTSYPVPQHSIWKKDSHRGSRSLKKVLRSV